MTEIPLWGAIVFAVLILGGAGLTLLGCLGLARLNSFYARVHAPTLGTSFGMVGVVAASALYFSLVEARPVLHEILILVFVTVTTPVTLMLLSRAALHRDRSDGNPDVPQPGPRVPAPQDNTAEHKV
ncbi:monovalent cation/H(+) antiporter subunit G [Pelagibacterium sp. 26DY04]|uniref:monovalent cation/H(+) antiporter subunit G n=1 Tax=Pelagibacterium sp. 26DY04 TaxID=2967130 RepID=UPI002816628B|nr:monovalent cation/H(+) antiporter subunit G [Pelagibacterium sp. 26DY04]WMT86820.1 monovalent cation/H(+) antiporter subunit G [Pelagibacterium sp. 26DY04]